MKILYVNAVCGVGSTGRIVVDLMNRAKNDGYSVKAACSTTEPVRGAEASDVIVVGTRLDYYTHNILSRITDHEGLYSKKATRRLIAHIKEFDPDLIHLHNIHGHWINYEQLFMYVREANKRVIWTLHDCWAFTGHCTHFSIRKCEQWRSHCRHCTGIRDYPKCYGKGDVSKNFERKKKAFTGPQKMTIVTPSEWLKELVKSSFLGDYPVEVIHNAIDLSTFKPRASHFREKYHLENKKIILGVANVWNQSKGYNDFLSLRSMMDDTFVIVMVGLSQEQAASLPKGVIAIPRTHCAAELAEIYTSADVFVNMTYQDNYPTVNLESIACGTPVVSYKTGGSCEAFDSTSGIAVDQGDLNGIASAIKIAVDFDRSAVLKRRKDFEKYGDYTALYTSNSSSMEMMSK